MKVLYLLFVWACIESARGALAPFITPCHRTDSECMKKSAQDALPVLAAGVPDLGIDTMDPMFIKHVAANSAGLKMDFRNSTVKGLRNCKVLKLERDSSIHLDLLCSVTLTGDYTLGGQLLFLPIEGDGKYKIKVQDILVKVRFNHNNEQVDGQTYWNLKNFRYTSAVQTGAEFRFQNLFNGNKQLSDTVHEFANSNWKEIFQEVAPPIVDEIVRRIYGEVDKLFKHVPVNQLALD